MVTTRKIVTSLDKATDILWRENVLGLRPNPSTACTQPFEQAGMGLPDPLVDPQGKKLPFTLYARCRKCQGCLAHRRRLWFARGVAMVNASRRTWFGTLTVAPEHRFRLRLTAEATRLRAGRETLEMLSKDEQFTLLAGELHKETTRFLKRVRSAAKSPFRYLLVTEEHKDGHPHLHMLLHEFGEPITKASLEDQWKYGFSAWRLVGSDPKAVGYVCKYLAKDLRTRVRASLGYGQADSIRLITERIEKMRDTILQAQGETEGTTPLPFRSGPSQPSKGE